MKASKYIDHTVLKPETTKAQILSLCEEAKAHDFASVCVNPGYIKLCAGLLKGTGVDVCTVVGFPLGATSTESKVFETVQAIKDGATEIDMVINISRLKEHDDEYVYNEIKAIKEACGNLVLKVIIETCLLTDEEKVRACVLSKKANADFVKTSTGFSTGGATVEDVRLMRETVGPDMHVKASGGVKDSKGFLAMIEAGADRVGASSGIKIMTELGK